MAIVLAMVVEGMSLFITTLWGLQERRFSSVFETVSLAARRFTMALVFCLLAIHRHRRGEFGMPFI